MSIELGGFRLSAVSLTIYRQPDNTGVSIDVPLRAEDDFIYFRPSERAAIKAYYDENGYVVIRGLVPKDLLDAANEAFDRQIVPSQRFIYRQATANPERHVFTEYGFMLNSLLNLQSLDPRHFGDFREVSVKVFSHETLKGAVETVLGEEGKLVQSMYFHGNPSTWPHQDTYYLDSEHLGAMTAVWIATEDIAPGAGRFFVYPRSHTIDVQKNGGDFDIATNHDRYKRLIVDIIRNNQLSCRAPALSKGDVLFWNAKTIHGSLPTTQPEYSRRSFTAHFIPRSHRFLQHQARIVPISFETENGLLIARPKDQAHVLNRAILFLETRFPKPFQAVKRTAIKMMLRRNA